MLAPLWAAALDLAALSALGVTPALAAALHLGAGLAAALLGRGPRSRRALGVALVILVPLGGALAALIAAVSRGESDGGELTRPAAQPASKAPGPRAAEVARSLPPAEAISSDDPELRRAALRTLADRGDAEAVAILRWGAARADGALALEAALALEDISWRLEAQLHDALRELEERPGFATAVAAGDAYAAPLLRGLTEPPTARHQVDRAEACYRRAAELAPGRAPEVAPRLARLALAALAPEAALEALSGADGRARRRLAALAAEAAFAARVEVAP